MMMTMPHNLRDFFQKYRVMHTHYISPRTKQKDKETKSEMRADRIIKKMFPLKCPACGRSFGDNARALGVHMSSHYGRNQAEP